MTATSCLFDSFRNAPTKIEICSCLLKRLQERKTLELKDNRSEEERELIMNLSPAYLQQREVWKEEGQGLLIEKLLEGRFGTLDEELKSLIPQIMQLDLSERTKLLLQIANLSRSELIARLSESLN
ncbi:hypothetical protein CFPU101_44990 [Chroococcus sp. FPU101]|nr:hypothetical protein CFPU101_44990 [Chroococcus sp. FPU101]